MSDSYYMKITPSGTTRAALTWAEFVKTLAVEWSKIKLIINSELQSRVFEKALGFLFLTLEPIIMAVTYYFLTKILLGSGLPDRQFLLIYVAVVFWRWFAKTVDGAPGVFATYAMVLKQTNFSVFSLIFVYIGVEFFAFLVAFSVLVIFTTLMGFPPNFAYLLLVFPMMAQLSIILFLSVFYATAGAFLRDLQGALYGITAIWFYLSPGIYPIERVPEEYLWIYYLNPFAHIIPAYQGIILRGEVPDIPHLLLITVIALTLAAGAIWLLGRARRHFFSFI